MTDDATTDRPDPGADPLDELATAIVDGTATPDEQARATEPVVSERVAVHRRVANRVAELPPPPSADRREKAIAAAVAAADDTATTPSAEETGVAGPPIPLRPRPVPARTTARSRRWLTAAAVVAALAVAIPVLTSVEGGDGDETAATAGDDAGEAEESFEEEADDDTDRGAAAEEAAEVDDEDSAGAEAALPSTTVEPTGAPGAASGDAPVEDFGRFTDLQSLLTAARSTWRAVGATTTSTAGDGTGGVDEPDVDRCAERFADGEPGAAVDRRATATVEDRPVVVLLVEEATTPRLVVLAAAGCEVLADRQL